MPPEVQRLVHRWGAVIAAVVALALAGGCSSVPQSRPPVQPPVDPAALAGVTLRVGDQKGGSQSLLAAAGLLNTPYKIQWSTFTSGPPLIEAARAGAIDVGGTGNTPVIFAAAARARVQIVSANQGNVASDAILVPGPSPLRSVGELGGKRVAVAKGSSAHGQLLYTLRRNGLTLDDVDLTFLAPADAFAAFKQGEVDAWATWDPYTAQAQLGGARTIATGEGTANGYGFQVASNAALADPVRQAAVGDLLTRIAAAQRYSDAHRGQRAKVWSKETKLPLPVTTLAAQRGPDLPVPMNDAVISSEQELADAFSDAGVIPGRVSFADFVDRRFEAATLSARAPATREGAP